jgi:uncharacterized protein DUF1016
MRAFAQAWPEKQNVQEALAQITWYHNLAILGKRKQSRERLWYARATLELGWSRNVLVHWIENDLYKPRAKPWHTSRGHCLPRGLTWRERALTHSTEKSHQWDFLFFRVHATRRQCRAYDRCAGRSRERD